MSIDTKIAEGYEDIYYCLTHPDRHSTGTVFADVMIEVIEELSRAEEQVRQLRELVKDGADFAGECVCSENHTIYFRRKLLAALAATETNQTDLT